ncbi:MAG: 2-oxo acid dehydrogenase subunit E2 [Rhodothermales bacterium]|nr:2-oxo acid dehydrogenase subunit E2 [Rhodothermales bacterium]
MAIAVEMPKMSDTMEEGVLVEWQVEEGTAVSAGDIIAQVETDKATMDLEVYDDGVLLKKVVAEGEAIPIGGLIAVLGNEGDDISAILGKYQDGAPAAQPTDSATEVDNEPDVDSESIDIAEPSGDGSVMETVEAVTTPSGTGGRILSSPLARRLANENNLSLTRISGSGPQGRIIKKDVEAALASGVSGISTQALPDDSPPEIVKLSQMRKAIARRLASSKFSSPHFYLTIDVDMVNAISFREQANANVEESGDPKISFNDLITKACGMALLRHPGVNSSFDEQKGHIAYHKNAHVAVAVAIDDGLITPVVRHASHKSLRQIAVETRELAAKARTKKLQPEEYEGSTFTTSNLGMFGIDEFTAIINPPNSCILAIGTIRDIPVVKDGEVVPGKQMKLTMSCDHRSVDGASGAQFLETVRMLLENPVQMIL